jgi:Zn-dependent protease
VTPGGLVNAAAHKVMLNSFQHLIRARIKFRVTLGGLVNAAAHKVMLNSFQHLIRARIKFRVTPGVLVNAAAHKVMLNSFQHLIRARIKFRVTATLHLQFKEANPIKWRQPTEPILMASPTFLLDHHAYFLGGHGKYHFLSKR